MEFLSPMQETLPEMHGFSSNVSVAQMDLEAIQEDLRKNFTFRTDYLKLMVQELRT